MIKFTAYLVILCLYIQAGDGRSITMEDLLERIENLENWKSKTEKEIETLQKIVARQQTIIEQQARVLEDKVVEKTTNEPNVDDSVEYKATDNDDELSVMDNNMSPVISHTSSKQHRAIRQSPAVVAFTAYLSQDFDSTSTVPQTMKFDQVITNEGSGYNQLTGVFTSPKTGLYLFSFFWGERGRSDTTSQIWAELVVNSKVLVTGAAETRHKNQDIQGGNTVVVRLNVGDVVWVETVGDGYRYHVEGGTVYHLTTFTGVYLSV